MTKGGDNPRGSAEEAPASGNPDSRPSEEHRSFRPWRQARLLAASSAKIVWGVVVSVMVTTALVAWVVPAVFGSAETVDEQVAAIRHAAAAQSLYPVFGRDADLGSGFSSYVMVLRYKSTVANPAMATVSDDVRVYDIRGGKLQLAFDFQPKPLEGFPFVYEVDQIGDVDGNGQSELIGLFAIQSGTGLHDPLPTVIAWNDDAQRFVIAPLLAHAPRLTPVTHPGIAQAYTQAGKPIVLMGSRSPQQIRGYPVDAFGVLRRTGDPPLVIGGFLARAPDAADPQLYQAVGWTLNLTLDTPDTYECPGPNVYVHPNTQASLDHQLVSAWVRQRGRGDCG